MCVNKYISEVGLCLCCEVDELLFVGWVMINGEVVIIGVKVLEGDEVCVDGEIVKVCVLVIMLLVKKVVYIVLNKLVGIICIIDQSVDGNIVDFVDYLQWIFLVGWLDKDFEGLILFISNGDIVNEILCVENCYEKEYLVVVNKVVIDEFFVGMSKGVCIYGQMIQCCCVWCIVKFGFGIVLIQGLNWQICLMVVVFGYWVIQLWCVCIDNIKFGYFKFGQWCNFIDVELKGLLFNCIQW